MFRILPVTHILVACALFRIFAHVAPRVLHFSAFILQHEQFFYIVLLWSILSFSFLITRIYIQMLPKMVVQRAPSLQLQPNLTWRSNFTAHVQSNEYHLHCLFLTAYYSKKYSRIFCPGLMYMHVMWIFAAVGLGGFTPVHTSIYYIFIHRWLMQRMQPVIFCRTLLEKVTMSERQYCSLLLH